VGTQTEDASATAPAANLQAKAREAYGRQSRQAVEDQLIIDHLPLVRHIVQKVVGNLGRRPDADDLISAGTIGLVRAARAYDPSRHTEFKTYAYIRVRGAVIDELRSQSFSSPSIRQRIRSIREAHRRHAVETGQPPTDQDLADRAGLSLRMYYQTVEEARRQHFLSIHGLSDDQPALANLLPADTTSPETEASKRELLRQLTQAVQELPERDRKVVLLYYERDLTMKEVAAVLDITESRVSQVHASALFKLSMKLRNVS
jgi:RNA polymerase sigma factor for flagellar operon FliA